MKKNNITHYKQTRFYVVYSRRQQATTNRNLCGSFNNIWLQYVWRVSNFLAKLEALCQWIQRVFKESELVCGSATGSVLFIATAA